MSTANYSAKRRFIIRILKFSATQDRTFPVDLYGAKKIMVILVPEHNAMSGGIYSLFSIANQMRRLKKHHGHEVLIVTRPTPSGLTYFRNTNFRNSENVYRFEQLLLCRSATEIYLHIPEYATEFFADRFRSQERRYLLSRQKVHINILNQNIKLMPEKDRFSGLREITSSISQSVAHHAYFNQAMADRYDLPTLLLPAYTDLSAYPPASFDEKEKLIIYSPDEAPHKKQMPGADFEEPSGFQADRNSRHHIRSLYGLRDEMHVFDILRRRV